MGGNTVFKDIMLDFTNQAGIIVEIAIRIQLLEGHFLGLKKWFGMDHVGMILTPDVLMGIVLIRLRIISQPNVGNFAKTHDWQVSDISKISSGLITMITMRWHLRWLLNYHLTWLLLQLNSNQLQEMM